MKYVALFAFILALSGNAVGHEAGMPHDHALAVAEAKEVVCFELPKQDCGCGLAKLVEEEPQIVCLPVKDSEEGGK